jgi:hypothetical protein
MHLCMQDDENGQKMMVLPSAEKTRLTHFFTIKFFFCSERFSPKADNNTTMYLPYLQGVLVKKGILLLCSS